MNMNTYKKLLMLFVIFAQITPTFATPMKVTATPDIIFVGSSPNIDVCTTQDNQPVSNISIQLEYETNLSLIYITGSNGCIEHSWTWDHVGTGIIAAWPGGNTIGSFTSVIATINVTGPDINGDGKIDIVDALLIAQHVSGYKSLNVTQLTIADSNHDGNVTFDDAMLVARYTVEL